jgi:hypothetical protein
MRIAAKHSDLTWLVRWRRATKLSLIDFPHPKVLYFSTAHAQMRIAAKHSDLTWLVRWRRATRTSLMDFPSIVLVRINLSRRTVSEGAVTYLILICYYYFTNMEDTFSHCCGFKVIFRIRIHIFFFGFGSTYFLSDSDKVSDTDF